MTVKNNSRLLFLTVDYFLWSFFSSILIAKFSKPLCVPVGNSFWDSFPFKFSQIFVCDIMSSNFTFFYLLIFLKVSSEIMKYDFKKFFLRKIPSNFFEIFDSHWFIAHTTILDSHVFQQSTVDCPAGGRDRRTLKTTVDFWKQQSTVVFPDDGPDSDSTKLKCKFWFFLVKKFTIYILFLNSIHNQLFSWNLF